MIAGWHEQPSLSIPYKRGVAGDLRSDDGHASRHRFKEYQGHAFRERGPDEHVDAFKPTLGVWAKPIELNPPTDPLPARETRQASALWSVTCEREGGVHAPAGQRGEGANSYVGSFVRHEATQESDPEAVVFHVNRPESLEVYAVGDDVDGETRSEASEMHRHAVADGDGAGGHAKDPPPQNRLVRSGSQPHGPPQRVQVADMSGDYERHLRAARGPGSDMGRLKLEALRPDHVRLHTTDNAHHGRWERRRHAHLSMQEAREVVRRHRNQPDPGRQDKAAGGARSGGKNRDLVTKLGQATGNLERNAFGPSPHPRREPVASDQDLKRSGHRRARSSV
jgi:hypothetical protein